MRPTTLVLPLLVFACMAGCDRTPSPGGARVGRAMVVKGSGAASGAVPSKPLSGPPALASAEQDGFVDLVFYISEQGVGPDGAALITARAIHGSTPLGFQIRIDAGWKGAKPGGPPGLQMRAGVVDLRSIGAESDAFLAALDRVYGSGLKPRAMIGEQMFSGISLEGDPARLDQGMVKIKMFYEPESEADGSYAEFYLNVDLGSKRVELAEKDPDYRKAVVGALRAP